MTLVIVPVRYPLTEHSHATVEKAIQVADELDADLTVLHVNLYQASRHVSRADLKATVEREFGRLPRARYVTRDGFLIEETILDEVAAEGADVVVIGRKQVSRWRRMVRTLIDDPDIEHFLNEKLDCKVITASTA
ncbi:universal stress protein [Haladaptatus sp. DJG-WS-42]|uniref:universal stress protein n=1 Tax=Haladaptatus sp. DJG-WS-42 TaxID=3120516 RepID=UPI0030CF9A70